MKKINYLITLIVCASYIGIKAQTIEGTPDANFSIYQNKLKKSDEGVTDEKKNISSKFWESRAELMMDIFDLNRDLLKPGIQQINVKLIYREPKEVKTWEKDGSKYETYIYERVNVTFKDGVIESFEETVVLHETPLTEALASLEKVEELDVDKKMSKTIAEDYNRLKKQFEILAIEEFIKEKFEPSYKSFAAITTINEKPVMEGIVDTTMIYYTGMAASKAGLNEEAIKYYEMARSYNYPDADLYIFLRTKYWETGDTSKGVEVLSEGFNKFPDNQGIVIELINYYLLSGKSQEALDYLKLAQEGDPKNLSFIFAEATLYDKQGNTEKALEVYQRCIDIDPTYFNAYYNIGVMYFNKAVEMYSEANSIKDPVEYGKAKDAGDVVLEKALPFMEKANEIAEANTTWSAEEKKVNVDETLKTLKTLYYRLQMTDKYEEVSAKLGE